MLKTVYRVMLHNDTAGFPNCWMIQYKKWYSKDWKFACGYYPSYAIANKCMKIGEGEKDDLRGILFTRYPKLSDYPIDFV